MNIKFKSHCELQDVLAVIVLLGFLQYAILVLFIKVKVDCAVKVIFNTGFNHSSIIEMQCKCILTGRPVGCSQHLVFSDQMLVV